MEEVGKCFYASNGNYQMIENLLDYWEPSTQELDVNFYAYYNWIAQMYQDSIYTPPLEDVLAIANSCPLTSSSVVYAARNLYNTLTGNINYFVDCGGNVATRQNKRNIEMIRLNPKKVKEHKIAKKAISIYPNPVNSNLNVSSTIKIKQVEIFDVLGKLLVTKKVGGFTEILDLSKVSKGLIIVKVVDEKNTTTIDKLFKN
jgi:hypothetical protein